MEQRRVRLGDIVDDYCPRERRVTNHAVVAMIEDDIRQTRCTACDVEHTYKAAQVPRVRKKPPVPAPHAPSPAAGRDGATVAAAREDATAEVTEPTSSEASPEPGAVAPAVLASPSTPGAGVPVPVEAEREEGTVRRPLIRATLPRPDGQPTTRPAPEFTMRQSGVRGSRLIENNPRGTPLDDRQPGAGSRPGHGRHGHRPDQRHGQSRAHGSSAGRFDRDRDRGHGPGHGRGGPHGHSRRGGKKQSR